MARTVATRYSVAEAKDRLPRIVRGVERGVPVEITRRGKPVVALVPLDDYHQMFRGDRGFWSACLAFRQETGVARLGLGRNVFAGVRDRSRGRSFDW